MTHLLNKRFFSKPLFFFTPPSPPSHLKMKSPHWKVKASSRKWFPEKNPEKSETVINTCASIIKYYWKKMTEIPQERDFLTFSIQNLVRKVKQFVRLLE